jgi:hypothetical protein
MGNYGEETLGTEEGDKVDVKREIWLRIIGMFKNKG